MVILEAPLRDRRSQLKIPILDACRLVALATDSYFTGVASHRRVAVCLLATSCSPVRTSRRAMAMTCKAATKFGMREVTI